MKDVLGWLWECRNDLVDRFGGDCIVVYEKTDYIGVPRCLVWGEFILRPQQTLKDAEARLRQWFEEYNVRFQGQYGFRILDIYGSMHNNMYSIEGGLGYAVRTPIYFIEYEFMLYFYKGKKEEAIE